MFQEKRHALVATEGTSGGEAGIAGFVTRAKSSIATIRGRIDAANRTAGRLTAV